MTAENTNRNDQVNALNDTDLSEVAGGYTYVEFESLGIYYRWNGDDNNRKYLCPNCKQPVHMGSWGRYYCDPCNASWYNEAPLRPNISSGMWQEISKDEYERGKQAKRLDRYAY